MKSIHRLKKTRPNIAKIIIRIYLAHCFPPTHLKEYTILKAHWSNFSALRIHVWDWMPLHCYVQYSAQRNDYTCNTLPRILQSEHMQWQPVFLNHIFSFLPNEDYIKHLGDTQKKCQQRLLLPWYLSTDKYSLCSSSRCVWVEEQSECFNSLSYFPM